MNQILFADDSRTAQAMVERFLLKLGYVVLTVPDGAQALSLVQQRPFFAVLMDMRMPVMDGVAATTEIRKLAPPVRDIPIIGLTAGTEFEMRTCINAGMDLVLPKPIDFELLALTLSAVTGQQGVSAPAPAKKAAAPRGNAPINLATFKEMVDDLGRAAVRAAIEAFRDEAPEQLGAIALAAARRKLDAAELALFNLESNAQCFGGERLCALLAQSRDRLAGQEDFLSTDFRALAEAAAQLIDLLDMALPSASAPRAA